MRQQKCLLQRFNHFRISSLSDNRANYQARQGRGETASIQRLCSKDGGGISSNGDLAAHKVSGRLKILWVASAPCSAATTGDIASRSAARLTDVFAAEVDNSINCVSRNFCKLSVTICARWETKYFPNNDLVSPRPHGITSHVVSRGLRPVTTLVVFQRGGHLRPVRRRQI